jgi:RNA polymerase sigma-70 factor (ECF subfamily)
MVFNLNVIEGYTHREIGKILNISENTSKSQLSRAKKVLQQKLRKLSENISLTDNYVLGQAV